MGSPQIRNLGTIGGNIAQSSVAGDGLAACVTLNADVTLRSVRGERTMNINDFLAGEGAQKRNILAADELLTEVSFPVPDTKHTATAFYKLAKRKSLAISVIGGGMYSCLTVGFAANALGGGGGPLAVFFVTVAAVFLGKLVSKRTPVDIIVTPAVTIILGVIVALIIAPPIGKIAVLLGELIMKATALQPFMCGGCRLSVGGEMKFACVDGPDFDGHKVDWDLAVKRNQMYKDFEMHKHEEVCNLFKKEGE